MKHKVGDKVRVHTIEWFEKNCSKNNIGAFVHEDGCYAFVSGMKKFCGKEITISNVFLDTYHILKYDILEDGDKWYWENWMFEDMNNNTNIISNPNIVEDFAKLIGVELDEEFYSKEYDYCYKITSNSGLMVYNTNTESWQVCAINTFLKMIKEGKFIKKWTPKDGDTVYCPDFLSKLYYFFIYNSSNEHYKEMLKNGLIFRTKEEAIECAKKIIKQMKEG